MDSKLELVLEHVSLSMKCSEGREVKEVDGGVGCSHLNVGVGGIQSADVFLGKVEAVDGAQGPGNEVVIETG